MIVYAESEKIQAREGAFEFAIKTLTKNRDTSTIARRTYIREVYDHIMQHGSKYDQQYVSQLTESEISHWERFFSSVVGKKKPSDLKVAYLCGPNPVNDLEVLVNKGILPENVWAFESETNNYDAAVTKTLESKFKFIKIFKGKIENYFKTLHITFDIIYLDFCQTLFSPNTISVVRDLFWFQKLNSPGILITNFAFPKKENYINAEWENCLSLCSNYLYSKEFTERLSNFGGGFVESPESYGLTPEEFVKKCLKNPQNTYSQFITRILYDLPSIILPYQRFASSDLIKNTFYKNFEKGKLPEDRYEDVFCFPTEHSIVWGLNNFSVDTDGFDQVLSKFRKQLSINGDEKKLLEVIDLMDFFGSISENSEFNSEKLQKIARNWRAFDKYILCDVFTFNQLKDILIGQLVAPYFYNVERTKRWTYKAKSTRMFMDAITFDQFRYLFDWMPTIDMFEEGVSDINRELTLRFAMDSIAKQRRWYNNEFFSVTAVIDQFTPKFKAKELKRRRVIN